MAWSEGRSSRGASQEQRRSEMLAGISRIDDLLDQLAADASFQQDLQAPCTKRALEHWTGASRLPPDEAEDLFDEDNYAFRTHIRPCLSKLARLQNECRQVQMALPLDRVLARKRTLFDAPSSGAAAAPTASTPAVTSKSTSTTVQSSKSPNANASTNTNDSAAPTTAGKSETASHRSTPETTTTEATPSVTAWPRFALLVLLAALSWRFRPFGT